MAKGTRKAAGPTAGNENRGAPRKQAAERKQPAPRKQAASQTSDPRPQRNGPSPEDRAACLAEFTRLSTEGQRINQAKSTLLKNFEKAGGKSKTLKMMHSLLKLDSREAQVEVESYLSYAIGFNIKVSWAPNGQSSLVEELGEAARAPDKNTEGSRDLAAARAHADGYNSGMQGAVPSDNPYRDRPGSEEYVQWHNGRDESSEALKAKGTAGITSASVPEVQPF